MAVITLKDLTLAGIGLLSSKNKKDKSIIEKTTCASEVNKGSSVSFIKDLIEKGKEQREGLRTKIKEETEKIVSEVGFLTKTDLRKIEDKINEIENLIST